MCSWPSSSGSRLLTQIFSLPLPDQDPTFWPAVFGLLVCAVCHGILYAASRYTVLRCSGGEGMDTTFVNHECKYNRKWDENIRECTWGPSNIGQTFVTSYRRAGSKRMAFCSLALIYQCRILKPELAPIYSRIFPRMSKCCEFHPRKTPLLCRLLKRNPPRSLATRPPWLPR